MSSTDKRPLLYSFRRCPYAMRARWSLLVSGQSCVIREILLRDKPAHMLELSPKGTVPVLQLSELTVIDESLDIMRWALSQADPEHWFKPEYGSLDEMEALIEYNDSDFKRHLDRYKYPNRYPDLDPYVQRKEAEKFIQLLEQRLTKYPFLFGSRRCLADIAIIPFVRQFSNVDKSWFEATSYSGVQAWANGLLNSDDFATVMTKYKVYALGSAREFFPLI